MGECFINKHTRIRMVAILCAYQFKQEISQVLYLHIICEFIFHARWFCVFLM